MTLLATQLNNAVINGLIPLGFGIYTTLLYLRRRNKEPSAT